MREIKKIKKISCANIIGLIYGIIGFLFSTITIIFIFMNSLKEKGTNEEISLDQNFNIGGAFLSIFLISITTGIFGWLAGYLTSSFYNIIAKKIGGLKIELTEEEKKEEEKEKENLFN